MTPTDVRRVALGVLAAALREQKLRVRSLAAEHGRTSAKTRKAAHRLDELREAYEAISAEHSSERVALMLLDELVREHDEGGVWSGTLASARDYLKVRP